MTRRIPQVAEGVLRFLDPSGEPEIAVASPSWIAWLTDPATRSFSFQSPRCRYTARKEYRSRGGEYWIAYRKKGGKLHKAYLVHLQERCWVMSCSAAYELAEHSCEVFPQCSHSFSIRCPEGLLIVH